MPGNTHGGRQAASTIRKRYGQDFFKQIGRVGGSASSNGGFASNKVGTDGLTGPERAKIAGAVGGAKSRRCKVEVDGLTKPQPTRVAVTVNQTKHQSSSVAKTTQDKDALSK